MANSQLYQKATFRLPANVLKAVEAGLAQHGHIKGAERARNLLAKPEVSYALAKKIKNFFDSFSEADGNQPAYAVYGGDEMKNWLNNVLSGARNSIVRTKTVRSNAGFENQFKKEYTRSDLKPAVANIGHLKPEKTKRMELFESLMAETERVSAICVVFSEEGKFLLVRRAAHDEWMPDKWALVGGGIEADESPEEALAREVREETNLEVTNLLYCFKTKEDGHGVYVFLAKCAHPENIKLDPEEHSEHQWVRLRDLLNYETVPLVGEYVVKCLKEFSKGRQKEKGTE